MPIAGRACYNSVCMKFHYAFKDRLLFCWDYFARKVFCLWFEVKRPRLKMFVYEMIYSALKIRDYELLYSSPFGDDTVETVFGRFRVRPRTVDFANVSPAFERRDVNRLLKLIGRLRAAGRRVLFLDIGADLGTYTVVVGNRFKDDPGLSIMAFEPASSSFGFLKENIRLNGLEGKAEPCNFPLYSTDGLELDFSFNPSAPGTSGLSASAPEGTDKVVTRTLDSVLEGRAGDPDALVLKMDVEGVETDVLRGAEKTLGERPGGMEVHFLVEDFVNPEIIRTLEGLGAEFVAKLTPYNSFWRLG